MLVAQQILQSLGLRSFAPQVTACPGCGRTTSTFFQHMAEDIQTYIREQMPDWRETHPGVETMHVAVMGCVVNGPGESKHANIGISLPGTFEEPKAPVYVDGRLFTTLKGERIVQEFLGILEEYVARTYPAAAQPRRTTGCGQSDVAEQLTAQRDVRASPPHRPFQLLGHALELVHDRRVEAELLQPLVDAPVPAYRPDRPALNRDHTVSGSSVRLRSARIVLRVVDLVGGADPARALRAAASRAR